MSGLANYAMQKALYSTLSGDSTLGDLIEGVYDYVPADAAFPYVTIGDVRGEDVSTMGQEAARLQMELHVYSRTRGRKECMDILSRILELLHENEPEVDGHRVVSLRYTGSEVALERDGLTYHGKMRLSALMAATA